MSQFVSNFKTKFHAPLSKKIITTQIKPMKRINSISPQKYECKNIKFSQHIINIKDIIAYQIGWGKLLIQ
ncbi:hypothetical protein COB28_04875 [Candidatus Dependentiae bacterium]|nr:MAG: hypothetical protein COB28_04875 [Candidatus Dependentiae bacterium]